MPNVVNMIFGPACRIDLRSQPIEEAAGGQRWTIGFVEQCQFARSAGRIGSPGRQRHDVRAVFLPHFCRFAVQQDGPQLGVLGQRHRHVLQIGTAEPEPGLMTHASLPSGDAGDVDRFTDRVENRLGSVAGGGDREAVRQPWILIRGHNSLARNIGFRLAHIGRVDVAQVFRFVRQLLIAGRLQGHHAALSRHVLHDQYRNLHTLAASPRSSRPRHISRCRRRKRLFEIHRQRQVTGHRPIEHDLPQIGRGVLLVRRG